MKTKNVVYLAGTSIYVVPSVRDQKVYSQKPKRLFRTRNGWVVNKIFDPTA